MGLTEQHEIIAAAVRDFVFVILEVLIQRVDGRCFADFRDEPELRVAILAAIREVGREAEVEKFLEMMEWTAMRKLPTVDRLFSSEDQKEHALTFAENRGPVLKGR